MPTILLQKKMCRRRWTSLAFSLGPVDFQWVDALPLTSISFHSSSIFCLSFSSFILRSFRFPSDSIRSVLRASSGLSCLASSRVSVLLTKNFFSWPLVCSAITEKVFNDTYLLQRREYFWSYPPGTQPFFSVQKFSVQHSIDRNVRISLITAMLFSFLSRANLEMLSGTPLTLIPSGCVGGSGVGGGLEGG